MATETEKLILEELKSMRASIDELSEKIIKLETSCGRMDGHITFVEKTYSTLKSPLDYMRVKVERLMNYNNNLLVL